MPSQTYRLFARAMAEHKQIVCEYGGFTRELCPVILGHTDGQEVTLTYQFAGGSSTRLPPGGDWKCFRLAEVTRVRLRAGPWHTGSRHRHRQRCVKEVDLDVNPASPYHPRRRLDG